MADEHAVEPPPGTPGQRALGAMESAVRRARAAGGTPQPPSETEGRSAERPPPPTGRPEAPPPPRDVVSADAAAVRPPDFVQDKASIRSAGPAPLRLAGDVRILDGAPLAVAPRREDTLELPETQARPVASTNRWLIGAVAVLAALVIVAGIALIVSLGGGSSAPPRTAANPAPTSAPPARTPTTIPTGKGTRRTTTTPSTTVPSTSPPASTSTSTAVGVIPGGPPTIASLSPASGSAGQTITVTGANFLSSSGQIVATFNGEVAPTSCPAQNTCTLTVPASMSSSAQVVITTSGGTSNAMTFTYS